MIEEQIEMLSTRLRSESLTVWVLHAALYTHMDGDWLAMQITHWLVLLPIKGDWALRRGPNTSVSYDEMSNVTNFQFKFPPVMGNYKKGQYSQTMSTPSY